jgi:hypothetical protein
VHLENIYFLAGCHTVDLKKYGFGKILEPYLNEATKLSSEEGVVIRVNNGFGNTQAVIMRAVFVVTLRQHMRFLVCYHSLLMFHLIQTDFYRFLAKHYMFFEAS